MSCRFCAPTVGTPNLLPFESIVIGNLESSATKACVLLRQPHLVAIWFFSKVASSRSQSTSSNCLDDHLHSLIKNSLAFSLLTSSLMALLRSLVSFLPPTKTTASSLGSSRFSSTRNLCSKYTYFFQQPCLPPCHKYSPFAVPRSSV